MSPEEDGRMAGAGLVIAGALLGGVFPLAPLIAGAFGGLALLAAVIAFHPRVVLLAVLPAAFIPVRVGSGLIEMSIADAILVLGILAALPRIHAIHGFVRGLAQIVAFYLAALIPVVVASPTIPAALEWAHRGALVGGGLLVGAAVARLQQERPAILLFLAASTAISIAACVTALRTGFDPAFPLGISKNHAGGLITAGLLILAAAPTRLGRRTSIGLAIVLFIGLLATQSRGAMVALFAGIGFLLLRRDANIRDPRVITLLVAGASAALFSLASLTSEEALPSSVRISSLSSRAEFARVAYNYWREAPLLGQGIRYYRDDERFEFPEPLVDEALYGDDEKPHPHNLLLEVLSESGAQGLIATAVLVVGAIVISVRLRSAWGDAAGAVLIGAVVAGSLDVFWVAGKMTVPWVIIGIGAGVREQRASNHRQIHLANGLSPDPPSLAIRKRTSALARAPW
ncbi:MAG: O-antigen ligase family protein [Actinomycetota bacterium]|nr:O-antigen ligase family protein [Actinomycetota bacterium]